ncbi:MAG: bifunctional 4-hydroxy-2-oxoglutarate aldolase/2-dehydro-3-deoxy-phosphogluconate aldolase [Thermoleophilia bacterium]
MDEAAHEGIDRRGLLAVGLGGVVAAGMIGARTADAATGSTKDGLPNTAHFRVVDRMARQRAIPVIRDSSWRAALASARRWVAAGATIVELTTSTADVHRATRALVAEGVAVGVGTMRTRDDVRRAAAAGASVVFAPGTFPALIDEALAQGIVPVPGTMTPTEVYQSLAAPMVKIYPAEVVGIPYLKALLAVYPDLRTYPNGGFTADPSVARAWLDAGATAIGISAGTFDDEAAIRAYLAAVRA